MPIQARFRVVCYIKNKYHHHRFISTASSHFEFIQQRDPKHLAIGILAMKIKIKNKD
jgi:hypothetical protein